MARPMSAGYFSRLDEVQPADQAEWGQWLDPAQGMIGWPAFQTKDGQTYNRAWGPGQTRIQPRQLTETLQAFGNQSQRSLQAMLYARPTQPPRLRRKANMSWSPPSEDADRRAWKSPLASTLIPRH